MMMLLLVLFLLRMIFLLRKMCKILSGRQRNVSYWQGVVMVVLSSWTRWWLWCSFPLVCCRGGGIRCRFPLRAQSAGVTPINAQKGQHWILLVTAVATTAFFPLFFSHWWIGFTRRESGCCRGCGGHFRVIPYRFEHYQTTGIARSVGTRRRRQASC